MKKYDLVVIGSGSGLNIISHFLDKNKKIALIENDKMGGTCLNRGCIPSKILLSHAEIINQIKSSDKFFIKSSYIISNTTHKNCFIFQIPQQRIPVKRISFQKKIFASPETSEVHYIIE